MAFDYSAMCALASGQIAEFGQEVTFLYAERTYNPVTGMQEEQDAAQHKCMALFLRPDDKALQLGGVRISDAMLLVSGQDLPKIPATGMLVTVQGIDWQVVSVNTVAPGGIDVLYKVYIRKD